MKTRLSFTKEIRSLTVRTREAGLNLIPESHGLSTFKIAEHSAELCNFNLSAGSTAGR